MKHLLGTALVMGLAMGLAACADDPATSAQRVADGSPPPVAKVVCERVAPTGSNVPVTRCAPAATAFDHMDARETVRTLAGPGAPAAGSNGGIGH